MELVARLPPEIAKKIWDEHICEHVLELCSLRELFGKGDVRLLSIHPRFVTYPQLAAVLVRCNCSSGAQRRLLNAASASLRRRSRAMMTYRDLADEHCSEARNLLLRLLYTKQRHSISTARMAHCVLQVIRRHSLPPPPPILPRLRALPSVQMRASQVGGAEC